MDFSRRGFFGTLLAPLVGVLPWNTAETKDLRFFQDKLRTGLTAVKGKFFPVIAEVNSCGPLDPDGVTYRQKSCTDEVFYKRAKVGYVDVLSDSQVAFGDEVADRMILKHNPPPSRPLWLDEAVSKARAEYETAHPSPRYIDVGVDVEKLFVPKELA